MLIYREISSLGFRVHIVPRIRQQCTCTTAHCVKNTGGRLIGNKALGCLEVHRSLEPVCWEHKVGTKLYIAVYDFKFQKATGSETRKTQPSVNANKSVKLWENQNIKEQQQSKLENCLLATVSTHNRLELHFKSTGITRWCWPFVSGFKVPNIGSVGGICG